MSEIDLLKRSSFAWVDLFGDDDALMANGFNAWGGIFWLDGPLVRRRRREGRAPAAAGRGRAHGLPRAGRRLAERPTRPTRAPSRPEGLAAQPPTEKQLQYLPPECRQDFGLTRYRASALMTFGFNKRAIRQLSAAASPERRAA
jgi:DNA repair protein RadD